jgi:hypothetical protein
LGSPIRGRFELIGDESLRRLAWSVLGTDKSLNADPPTASWASAHPPTPNRRRCEPTSRIATDRSTGGRRLPFEHRGHIAWGTDTFGVETASCPQSGFHPRAWVRRTAPVVVRG